MAASVRFKSTSASWSEAYMNGKRGGGGGTSSGSLDRSASFRTGSLAQCLSLDPFTIGDRKIDRSGEFKRVMGLIVGSKSEDEDSSSPPVAIAEDLKRLRSSVVDTCNTASFLWMLCLEQLRISEHFAQQIPIWCRWYYWANPLSRTIYGLVTGEIGEDNYTFAVPGAGNMTVKGFLKGCFGYDYDFLPVVAIAHAAWSLLFFFAFVFAIKFLNFQYR